ncbi:hypothetical protein QZH41_020666 [Actinostola sp. cb2023]|nr:hypothetical protein QZH41_020666 [Actinostola sp. cb2023]
MEYLASRHQDCISSAKHSQSSISFCYFAGANVLLDFVGDVSFDGAVRYYHKRGLCSHSDTFAKVAPVFKESDLVIGNLESPFVRPDMKADAQLKFFPLLICSDPDNVEALKYAGFDIMNLANNHLNDYKTKPINYTVKLLREHGIHSFGYNCGSIEEQRPQNPLIVERNGIKIGFLGYCSTYRRNLDSEGHVYYHCVKKREELDAGPAIYTDEAATRDVNRIKDKVDIIVVMMHWGVEYVTTPTKRQQKQAAHLQSIGVHVVIGGHPHVLQGHSISGKSLVSFSVGNLLFGPKYKNKPFYCNRKPSEKTQKELEEYMATSGLEDDLQSRIFRVQLNKQGVVTAAYLPLRIQLNPKTKCLQPTPIKNAKWIIACSPEDKACLRSTE